MLYHTPHTAQGFVGAEHLFFVVVAHLRACSSNSACITTLSPTASTDQRLSLLQTGGLLHPQTGGGNRLDATRSGGSRHGGKARVHQRLRPHWCVGQSDLLGLW